MNVKIEDKLEKISDLEIDSKNIEKLLKTIRDDKLVIINKETELMNRQELIKLELLNAYTTLKELLINEKDK
jgi:hypothetical protein